MIIIIILRLRTKIFIPNNLYRPNQPFVNIGLSDLFKMNVLEIVYKCLARKHLYIFRQFYCNIFSISKFYNFCVKMLQISVFTQGLQYFCSFIYACMMAWSFYSLGGGGQGHKYKLPFQSNVCYCWYEKLFSMSTPPPPIHPRLLYPASLASFLGNICPKLFLFIFL